MAVLSLLFKLFTLVFFVIFCAAYGIPDPKKEDDGLKKNAHIGAFINIVMSAVIFTNNTSNSLNDQNDFSHVNPSFRVYFNLYFAILMILYFGGIEFYKFIQKRLEKNEWYKWAFLHWLAPFYNALSILAFSYWLLYKHT